MPIECLLDLIVINKCDGNNIEESIKAKNEFKLALQGIERSTVCVNVYSIVELPSSGPATTEAIYNVKRIRTHPSLALWCGNNEVLSLKIIVGMYIGKLGDGSSP